MGENRTEGPQHNSQPDTQYVSVREAAKLLNVHRNTVHSRIKSGRIRAHKVIEGGREIYRIERDSLGIRRTGALVHTLDAQRPITGEEIVRLLTDRLENVVQGYVLELGNVREQLGEERGRRKQAQERVEHLEAGIHEEREKASKERERALELEMALREAHKGFWRRLFGG
jgi:excisionase family DNA binding protein